jgi:hypothetical protein
MIRFNDYYYYLKTIRWILNNSLAETSFPSSSESSSDIQKERKNLDEKKIKSAINLDLEKWSEYKVKRLAEEVRMD